MKIETTLAYKNIKGKPLRSAALILLAAFLALSIFGGSLIVLSLQKGLNSYEERLGADIVVVPNEARTKGNVESILLQGIPGYFYMNTSVLDKIRGMDGVEVATPQFYLCSSKAGCCSTAVQIIGYDPETDFVIQPWISNAYGDNLADGTLVLGNHISMPVDRTMTFYGRKLQVVAQLDETGTGLDNAVYANMDTIRQIMDDADAKGFSYHSGVRTDEAISSVMIRVKDGYDIDRVTDDINIHVRRIEATQAKTMISSIAGGLHSVSHIISVLTALIWVLAIVILVIAFTMITNERKKEFAILRVMGASQKMLARQMLTESALISAVGALLGLILASLIAFPFSNLIRARLGLPYLLPGAGVIAALMLGSFAVSVVAGALTAAVSARRLSRCDAALVLREGA
ncbi:MAG: ABC transporter permease [Oscillospiraceae bacterium]|nr:ABC transporter permease [Oscillospiraceae bacterium]